MEPIKLLGLLVLASICAFYVGFMSATSGTSVVCSPSDSLKNSIPPRNYPPSYEDVSAAHHDAISPPASAPAAAAAAPAGSHHAAPATPTKDLCTKSMTESRGFFCESDAQWEARREKAVKQSAKQVTRRFNYAQEFFQYNWEPEFACTFEERIGVAGDGGKWVCDPSRINEMTRPFDSAPEDGKSPCMVISIGSDNDFNFEAEVHSRLPHCEIHSFDHTVANPTNKPPYVHFYKAGIGSWDSPPLYTLSSLIKMTGRKPEVIEIFKIDAEGAEFSTIPQISTDHSLPLIRQMLIEIHPSGGVDTHGLFWSIRNMGMVMFHKEPNILASGVCSEFSFINLKGFITPDHARKSP